MNLVKVSISFISKDNDPQLLVDTDNILNSMTDNAGYPTPSPTLAVVKSARAAFANAVAAAADGGKALTAAKNNARNTLENLLRALSNYVQSACNNDYATLLTSGFPTQKPQRQPIGPVAVPANLNISQGAVSGTLNAKFSPVFGASVYSWRFATDAAPATWQDGGQTTAASTSFDTLSPGTVYFVQANAVGTAGASDWSNSANLMVI